MNFHWTQSEKRLARAVFDSAVQAELAELIAEFKRKAAAVESSDEMWALQEFLERTRYEFDHKYDYRYSVLIFVLARLVREGRIKVEDLEGLSADKLEHIHRILSVGGM